MYKNIVIVISLSMMISTALAKPAPSEVQQLQAQADELFVAGDYKKAKKRYTKLAKVGDKFSQHRLSMMYLQGLGVSKDLIDSFAWAYLAAEGDSEDLDEVRNKIYALLPESNRKAAKKKARSLSTRYGDLAVALEMERKIKSRMRGCTGSRLGNSCDKLTYADMPRNVSVTSTPAGNPGDFSGGDDASSASGGASSTGGGANAAAEYLKWQESLREIQAYIEEHSGEVELRELEIKEEQS